jgi:hypothetical protein
MCTCAHYSHMYNIVHVGISFAKIEGQLQESRDRCSTLEEQLKTYQVETFSVRYIFVWVAAHADSTS